MGPTPVYGARAEKPPQNADFAMKQTNICRLSSDIKICDDIPISPELIDVHTLNFKPHFTFSRLKFFWGPPSQSWCALGSLGQSLARVKMLEHSTPYGPKYSLPKNVHLGRSICTSITFSFVDHCSGGGVAVDQLHFRFSICGSVSEIFAIKVESCQKSRKILDGFLTSQILGGRASKNRTHVITPGSRHVVWKKDCEDIPTRPEVIDAQTLNFRPNFQCARLKFFGRPPSQLGCALGSLGQCLAHVKISGCSTP